VRCDPRGLEDMGDIRGHGANADHGRQPASYTQGDVAVTLTWATKLATTPPAVAPPTTPARPDNATSEPPRPLPVEDLDNPEIDGNDRDLLASKSTAVTGRPRAFDFNTSE